MADEDESIQDEPTKEENERAIGFFASWARTGGMRSAPPSDSSRSPRGGREAHARTHRPRRER